MDAFKTLIRLWQTTRTLMAARHRRRMFEELDRRERAIFETTISGLERAQEIRRFAQFAEMRKTPRHWHDRLLPHFAQLSLFSGRAKAPFGGLSDARQSTAEPNAEARLSSLS